MVEYAGHMRRAAGLNLTADRQKAAGGWPPWLLFEGETFTKEGALDFLRVNPALAEAASRCPAELGAAWYFRLAKNLNSYAAPELVGANLVLAAWAVEEALADPEWSAQGEGPWS